MFSTFVFRTRTRVLIPLVLTGGLCFGQKDPGPRTGQASAGGTYVNLTGNQQSLFAGVREVFQEVDSVSGKMAGEEGKGLGPAFNGNSCAQCHAQPTIGGSSPGLKSPQRPMVNPQVELATLQGAKNRVPPFITMDGPVRVARFKSDGGVHGLYTIAGRRDAPGCNLTQPDFAAALAKNDVIFRIPTPVYGLGLVETTPDAALQANLNANLVQKVLLGIGGRFNTNGNDGTITRFGWKAQNKSLLIFAGEAYNVEQGVSNEVFPNERSAVAGCVFNPAIEDVSDTDTSSPDVAKASDVTSFAAFMRLLAPPVPTVATASTRNGSQLFGSVGCANCHSPALASGRSQYAGLSQVTYHPYSDFALHHMGRSLSDGITQGMAGPDEFRTAPLWGVGQRLFFLHDGRTADLMEAIQEHVGVGSEANVTVGLFNLLPASQKQDLLNFLRSL